MDKQTKINLIFIGGIIFLLFGLFKFIFGLVNFIYKNNNDNNKVLKFFLSPDKTTASLVFEIIIFLFGIYSIIKGSYYLKLITYKPLVYLIEHHIFTYSLYAFFGIFLTLLYTFIAYYPEESKKYINSDSKYDSTYKFVGINTGLVFLITLVTILIINNYKNKLLLYFLIALFILIASLILTIMIKYGRGFMEEYLTFFMIPAQII